MSIFDLLFIAAFFGVLGALIFVAVSACRGHWTQAATRLKWLGAFVATYFAVVVVVSVVSPQRVFAVGHERCFDDWCIAVADVHASLGKDVASHAVTFRISSRARRVAQRERGWIAYVFDDSGRRFDAQAVTNAVPFDVLLQPGQSIDTVRVFETPLDARHLGLVLAHEGGYHFPGCCIIGEDGSFFHKRTVVQLN